MRCGARHSELVAQQERLLFRDSEVEHLKLLVAKLRRMIFGAKSERVTRETEQLDRKLEELASTDKCPMLPKPGTTMRYAWFHIEIISGG